MQKQRRFTREKERQIRGPTQGLLGQKLTGNNMKLFTTLVAAVLSTLALADDHRPNSKYFEFYDFIALDPAAVVAATGKFSASDCGKTYPADVGLAEELFNGAYQSTHFFINTCQNAAD